MRPIEIALDPTTGINYILTVERVGFGPRTTRLLRVTSTTTDVIVDDNNSSCSQIHPQPVSDRLQITVPFGVDESTRVVMSDVNGRSIECVWTCIDCGTFNNSSMSIDLTDYQSGLYWGYVESGKFRCSFPVIVRN